MEIFPAHTCAVPTAYIPVSETLITGTHQAEVFGNPGTRRGGFASGGTEMRPEAWCMWTERRHSLTSLTVRARFLLVYATMYLVLVLHSLTKGKKKGKNK